MKDIFPLSQKIVRLTCGYDLVLRLHLLDELITYAAALAVSSRTSTAALVTKCSYSSQLALVLLIRS
jgi:hypothetical protein